MVVSTGDFVITIVQTNSVKVEHKKYPIVSFLYNMNTAGTIECTIDSKSV